MSMPVFFEHMVAAGHGREEILARLIKTHVPPPDGNDQRGIEVSVKIWSTRQAKGQNRLGQDLPNRLATTLVSDSE